MFVVWLFCVFDVWFRMFVDCSSCAMLMFVALVTVCHPFVGTTTVFTFPFHPLTLVPGSANGPLAIGNGSGFALMLARSSVCAPSVPLLSFFFLLSRVDFLPDLSPGFLSAPSTPPAPVPAAPLSRLLLLFLLLSPEPPASLLFLLFPSGPHPASKSKFASISDVAPLSGSEVAPPS